MEKFYVEQHAGFALGNFIALTPTIRFLSDKLRMKIPVKFNTEYVKQCFIDCDFIEIIEKPKYGYVRLFGSELICRKNTITDYQFVFETVLRMLNYDPELYHIPKPHIDTPMLPINMNSKYGVFINGSGSENESYLDRKLVPFETQYLIENESKIPILSVGSLNDSDRTIFDGHFGDVRNALAFIQNAEFVISNVTGFYHASGAMEKKQLVLVKNCLFPRCSNINPNQIISNKGNWHEDIKNFLK